MNLNKRSLAVVLAALFMVCASFVVLADEANASTETDEISGKDLVDDLGIKRVEMPADADVVISGNYDITTTTYTGKTILVKSGANINQEGTVTLDGCTVYIQGTFQYSGIKLALKGDYTFVFDGITADFSKIFGDATVFCANTLAVTGTPAGYTLASVEDVISPLDVETGSDSISVLNSGKVYATFSYTDTTGKAFLYHVAELLDNTHVYNLDFDGDFKNKRYTLGYQYGTNVSDTSINEMKNAAKADKDYTKTIDVGDYKVKLDSKAILAIDEITLTITVGPASGLTDKQISAAGARPVYTVTMGDMHDLQGGSVTVTIPYSLGTNEVASNLYVVCIADDGSIEKLPTTYDAATGTISFTTTHLSDFSVFYGYQSEDDDGGNNVYFFAAFGVAVVLLIVAIVPNLLKKKE